MKRELIYTDFDLWHENSIEALNGLRFAPEDLVTIEHIRGASPAKSASIFTYEYFSFNEATSIEKKLLRPNGWRLPTILEWELLPMSYNRDIGAMTSSLNLECSKMESGCYWSSESCGRFSSTALAFRIHETWAHADVRDKKARLRIRCVAI